MLDHFCKGPLFEYAQDVLVSTFFIDVWIIFSFQNRLITGVTGWFCCCECRYFHPADQPDVDPDNRHCHWHRRAAADLPVIPRPFASTGWPFRF